MKKMKAVFSLILVIAMIGVFTGCSNNDDTNTTPSNQQQDNQQAQQPNNPQPNTPPANQGTNNLSGPVTISGSTSVEKVGVETAEEFMALNPNVVITYESIGSGGGITNGNERVTNIGATSRDLKSNEKEFGLVEKVIAYDGIAVITHPSNPVEGLTKEEVRKIYAGEITNWSEVGGKNESIMVVSREAGSGTRGAYEEIMNFELVSTATVAEGNGNVQSTVAGNPQAIGYVSFTYINDTIKPLNVDGYPPTVEDVLANRYTVARPFIYVYHEDNMNDAAKAYIEFVMGDGQKIVESLGGIPVN
ncbi:phosphate ABC transporter substrate-binding protein (PhoT family) [Natranaerovirga pectinivora]|uniref:Phosphate ABC transporter substrate-binding protein (PhoT family) n=1 Tax=Natranaerovirga pectinivora TaxID=682400 RepID=A0A4R3MN26_9FIRM|nr:phosphate ABC transporter substrate-binding protein [Natranaerovirga pectinivora]TCT15693.1 phosphate ABC transporter substrate-binding protein (PhoT family) [Natranaerovirga pectinivora]